MCKEIRNKKISLLLILLLLVTNVPVFAGGYDTSLEMNTLITNETNGICTELSQKGGTFTLFYNDKVDDKTLVISQSTENVIIAYYNDGRNIYEINNLPSLNFENISNYFDLENLAENIINENMELVDINTIDDYSIVPFGLSNARSKFYSEVGRGFSEKQVASKTINNKRAVVYEREDVSVKQIDKHVIFAGKTFAFLLSLLKLPPHVALGLGIVLYIKDGIEYVSRDYTILEYNGFVEGYKDIDVNGRTTHQVSSTYKYRLMENSGNDKVDISLLWGSEDKDFSNNLRLMETAVYNYR